VIGTLRMECPVWRVSKMRIEAATKGTGARRDREVRWTDWCNLASVLEPSHGPV